MEKFPGQFYSLTAASIEEIVSGAMTIGAALRRHAASRPLDPAYTFLSFGDVDSADVLSYEALHRRAMGIARAIREHCADRSRVLLLFPPGPDFVAAFFGCLYAGTIAVPADLPRRRARWNRLESIIRDASPSLLLSVHSTLDSLLAQAQIDDRWLTNVKTIAVDELSCARTFEPHPDEEDESSPGDIAFLQYTSGSTSAPKGVMVSHRNVLATMLDIQRGWRHDGRSVMVTWLPTFHDMGLIYGTLLPIVCGFRCYAMAPAAFLQKPIRWLKAISDLGATHTAAANFAYQVCVDKITPAQSDELDLGSWRVAVNGAEPVRPETLEAFVNRFQPHGFRAVALCPGYGLAEATLKVTSIRDDEPPRILPFSEPDLRRGRAIPVAEDSREAQRLVSCGTGEIGGRIEIVRPATSEPCDPDEIGEIWVQSDSVASGYWERPAETAISFRAGLSGGDDSAFLRTGDLGFLSGGHLYVLGRIKDLLIVHGLNIHPQDIEATVGICHPALKGSPGAAFAVEGQGRERLVIVQEVARADMRSAHIGEIAPAIRQAVWDAHEVQPESIVLLRPASIPRTTSGKIQRQECRARYLAGTLDTVDRWDLGASATPVTATPGELEAWAVSWISHQKHLAPQAISAETPFTDLGLDSVDAVSFSSALFEHLGRSDTRDTLLWEYPTIRSLCAGLTGSLAEPAGVVLDAAATAPVDDLENLSEAELLRLLLAELTVRGS